MISYTQIEELVTDRRFQELKFRQEKTNVFTIVGQTHTEHWHSSFIKWLIDPHSSLRLGHFPLTRLLTMYMIKQPDCGFDLRDIYSWGLDDIRFFTERDASFDGKKRAIDIYGESDELIIVIENKVNARENYNKSDCGQTEDYYNYVMKHKKEGQRVLCFFITADQKQTSYSDKYVHISYQEMFDGIISKCMEHPQASDDGKYLMEQYAANLRENIHNSNMPMALVNIDLCKEIYDDHSETLDEIFRIVDSLNTNISSSPEPACMVYEHYQSIFDEIFLSVEEKFGHTPKSQYQRQSTSFEDLYKCGAVKDNEMFTMKYDGETYYAKVAVRSNGVFFVVLDENKKFYRDSSGEIQGVYKASSSAGVDAINMRRKEKGISGRIPTLRGTTYWVNEEGLSIKDLIDKHCR